MTNTDAEGKRGESPAPDEAAIGGESAGAGAPTGGVAVPPERAGDRPGFGGIEEAGLGGGAGDLGGGQDLGSDDDRAGGGE